LDAVDNINSSVDGIASGNVIKVRELFTKCLRSPLTPEGEQSDKL
jgi:hypothetical protein